MGRSILERRIKRLLDDIVDIAFSSDTPELINNYKKYSFNILPKEKKTSSGCYSSKYHSIEIYNPSLGAKHLAKCCLHELSHHIDWVQNGCTGHQKPFYAVYAKLIYASIDMGILVPGDFYDPWASDGNKVRNIVEKYKPRPVDYVPDSSVIIRVYNGFGIKNELKNNRYQWNGLELTWEKEVDSLLDEEKGLNMLGVEKAESSDLRIKKPYYTIEEPGMYVDAPIYILAGGHAYEKRTELKAKGFFYKSQKKSWIMKCKASQLKEVMINLQADPELDGVSFYLMKNR